MSLTAEQISKNWDDLLQIVDDHITGERKDQLKKLYTDHQERIMMAPASPKSWYHSAFPGGYVDHVLRVTKCALANHQLWLQMGSPWAGDVFTVEELVFAALNHDLGKIGYDSPNSEYYLPNDSQWHIDKLGQLFKYNPTIANMKVPERSLFILQGRGIHVTENEYLAIRLHDGLYDDSNKYYFMSGARESRLRTNLPLILHHADHMASQIEYEMWDIKHPIEVGSKPKGKSFKPKNASKADKTIRNAKAMNTENNPKLAASTKSAINDFFKD